MKKKVEIPAQVFNLIFPDISYDKYMNLPRKTKKKKKKKLEEEFSQIISKWLREYERRG